jgi:acyl-CoA thioesterase
VLVEITHTLHPTSSFEDGMDSDSILFDAHRQQRGGRHALGGQVGAIAYTASLYYIPCSYYTNQYQCV